MHAKQIRTITLANGLFIIVLSFFYATDLSATNQVSLQLPVNVKGNLQQVLEDLEPQELIAIDMINRRHYEQRIVLEHQLRLVEDAFNKQLKVNREEPAVRKAFAPVARILEEMVVNDTRMVTEINSILAAHQNLNTPQQADVANVEIKD